jgi:hypothetical protein
MKHKKVLTGHRLALLKGYSDGFYVQKRNNPYKDEYKDLHKAYNTGFDGGTLSFCLGEKGLEFDENFRIIEESEK